MGARKRSASTPLDARQQALLEQQEKLREKMERLERVIEEAPKKQEQAQKRLREEMVARAVGSSRRSDASILPDKRLDASMARTVAVPRRRRALKAEQRQARLTFFALVLGLALLVVWLYSVWRW